MVKPDKEKKPTQTNQTAKALANFSQVGVTMAASVLIGVFFGKFLDNFFHTSPWLLLLFSFFGVGAAIKSLFNWSDEENHKEEGDL